MSRSGITVEVVGMDDLNRLTDEIESLVHQLRLKIGELKDKSLRFEMMLNLPQETSTGDSAEVKE